MNTRAAQNKRLVLEAFDTLFNKRDYASAEKFWSPPLHPAQRSYRSGRDGLFNLVRRFRRRSSTNPERSWPTETS